MSRKPMFSKKLVDGQSLASGFSSDPVDVSTVDNIGVSIATSGVTSNTGSFYVDHRIKSLNTSDVEASEWVELSFGSVPTLADADDQFLFNMNQLPPGQIRVRFTTGGGADGSADIWVSGKGV